MTDSDMDETMTSTTQKAKNMASSAMDMAADAGRTMKDEVSARASETMGAVRDAASERAEGARDSIVDAGDRLAETLNNEASSAEGMQQRVLSGLATGVSSVTDTLRGQSMGDVMASVRDYARAHPGTFAVGAAVAGFALARFLRSSGNGMTAEQRAAEATDRIYRDAARRSVDTLGHNAHREPLA